MCRYERSWKCRSLDPIPSHWITRSQSHSLISILIFYSQIYAHISPGVSSKTRIVYGYLAPSHSKVPCPIITTEESMLFHSVLCSIDTDYMTHSLAAPILTATVCSSLQRATGHIIITWFPGTIRQESMETTDKAVHPHWSASGQRWARPQTCAP